MGNTVRVAVDPGCRHYHQLTPSLRISSLAGAECSRSSSIRNLTSISARYRRRFQIRQSSEQKHPETAVGNMPHFRGQDLESRLEWMLSGENNSSLSVPHPHDKFGIDAHINLLCRMLFPGGRPTSLAHSSMLEKTHPWSFQLMRKEPEPSWILEQLQPNVT